MTKGHVFLAQNSDVDYVQQAYALALSIKIHNQENNTCIVTNDVVPEEYRHAFDYIIPIPWKDSALTSQWKIENRWKIIYATPFDENIVYDVDMLLLESNDHWWKYFEDKDLCFTTRVTDYRGNIITSDYYRKSFTANGLDNIYTGAFYFKKVNTAYEFFKWLEIIVVHWQKFYRIHLKNSAQRFCSIDLSAALALRFMGHNVDQGGIPSFTHMKPGIQGWKTIPSKWTNVLNSFVDDALQLRMGNFQQSGLLHYVEEEFLTTKHIDLLRKAYARKFDI
jgi:hypothetical protein